MGKYDITETTYTDMESKVDDYSVSQETTDGASGNGETTYQDEYWTKYFGYYVNIPELKKAIDAYATWVLGKGYVAEDERHQAELDQIRGWGEDTFQSVLWNMIVVKKISTIGAFAEIIRNDLGEVVNLKPLDPGSMKTVVDEKGIVKRYEQVTKVAGKNKVKNYQPEEILHLVNDRIADEIHSRSVVESVQWVIDARQEAMEDLRRNLHRSTIRIMEVEEDDKTRLAQLKADYAEAIKKGEVLLVPKGTGKIEDFSATNTQHLEWIRYLENFFYQALGIPKVILGGSEEFTEASSKISYLTYEQVYTREVVELEADLWNQCGIKIKFNKPASLKNELLDSEQKNTGQVGFQPSDTTAGVEE